MRDRNANLPDRGIGHERAYSTNDISPRSVERARQRTKGDANVEFLVGDIVTLADEGTVDLIALPDVWEHIPKVQHDVLFKKLAEVLSPGGAIVVTFRHLNRSRGYNVTDGRNCS